ncbi:hypothetical protein Q4Q39_00390 [Flavivirga amylovorans]|uniref:Uncharacterized protein n=1 Tax=Flavivirga amylovorans TaxID=870486 RepID=A0ABT8WVZ0_9FLAO|nr:hypothetical protein [Flavivirga amylovorans]MDO5985848.1 hypothetical protein [Flavivirga amylovorans]
MYRVINFLVLSVLITTNLQAQDVKSATVNHTFSVRVVKNQANIDKVEQLLTNDEWKLYTFRKDFFAIQPTIKYSKNDGPVTVQTKDWKMLVASDGTITLFDLRNSSPRKVDLENGDTLELLAMGLLIDDLIDYEIKQGTYYNSRVRTANLLMCVYFKRKLQPLNLSDGQWSKIDALSVQLARDIRDTRKNFEIDAEIMYRKDIARAYYRMKKLKGETLFNAYNKAGEFSQLQIDGIKKTDDLRVEYKNNAMNLLSKKQKTKLASLGKK